MRSQCQKLTQALAWMHSQNICHGDLTPRNILLDIAGLDSLPEDALLEVLGTPRVYELHWKNGEPINPAATPSIPACLVYPVTWAFVDAHYLGVTPSVIDLGECFDADKSRPDIGTPLRFRSPELVLTKSSGKPSDVWALACTLFELRTGRRLFDPFNNEEDEYLVSVTRLLGKLPEPLWSNAWETRSQWYDDTWVRSSDLHPSYEKRNANSHPSVIQVPTSMRQVVRPGVWFIDDTGEAHWEMDEEEQALFADSLEKMLSLDTKDRMTVEEALRHEWFAYES